jgi:hypothetical protein
MLETIKASDQVVVVGQVSPNAQGAGDASSGWIKASDYWQFLAIVQAGGLGTNATLDAKLEQATDGSGTGAKDVTGAAITQLTQAGTDSDKLALINLDPSKLDVANDFDYFRLTLTVATATSEVAGLVLGLHARYGNQAAHIAAVDEVVTP